MYTPQKKITQFLNNAENKQDSCYFISVCMCYIKNVTKLDWSAYQPQKKTDMHPNTANYGLTRTV